MDGQKFDNVARYLAKGTSRRQLLRTLLGATFVGSSGSVAAQPQNRPQGLPVPCVPLGAACGEGTQCCGGASCVEGICAVQQGNGNSGNGRGNGNAGCAAGLTRCGPLGCVDLLNDPANCGVCGHACPSDACHEGACLLTLGEACASGDVCASGRCADGVCCDATCDGQCLACNLPNAVGTCAFVSGSPIGNRPPCGAPTCVDGALTTHACDGNGACGAQHLACDPYRCDQVELTCLSSCASNDHCVGEAHCRDGQCIGDLADREACTSPSQCLSGWCVDDICCPETQVCATDFSGAAICCNSDQRCVGTTLAGVIVGQCCAEEDACGQFCCTGDTRCVDDECCSPKRDCGELCCGLFETCVGGACCADGKVTEDDSGVTVCCGADEQPLTGGLNKGCCAISQLCALGTVCCPEDHRCDMGNCVFDRCENHDDCSDGYSCDEAGSCILGRANGESCDTGDECTSGFCIDKFVTAGKVCCESACPGECRSCDTGVCTAFPNDATLPCTLPNISNCYEGVCKDGVCTIGAERVCISQAGCASPYCDIDTGLCAEIISDDGTVCTFGGSDGLCEGGVCKTEGAGQDPFGTIVIGDACQTCYTYDRDEGVCNPADTDLRCGESPDPCRINYRCEDGVCVSDPACGDNGRCEPSGAGYACLIQYGEYVDVAPDHQACRVAGSSCNLASQCCSGQCYCDGNAVECLNWPSYECA